MKWKIIFVTLKKDLNFLFRVLRIINEWRLLYTVDDYTSTAFVGRDFKATLELSFCCSWAAKRVFKTVKGLREHEEAPAWF